MGHRSLDPSCEFMGLFFLINRIYMLNSLQGENFYAFGANVVPIVGKAPIMKWEHLHAERQTIEELRGYDWTRCTGLGIVCGVNGYVCIDIDKAASTAAVSTILEKLGLPSDYTWTAKSGSGVGYHIWVRIDGEIPGKKGVVKGLSKDGSFDHLEIRWRECQTLVPPSVHSSGGQYVWMNAAPTVAPEFVSVGAILDAFESVAYVKTDDNQKVIPTFQNGKYTDGLMNGVTEGNRNDWLTSLSGHYRKLGMEYSEALVLLLKVNAAVCNPPLDPDEVQKIVESVFSYPSSDMVIRTGLDMHLMEPPVMNDIVDGIIGERSLNLLAGEEGGGKSLLAMNLGVAVATGAPTFLGYAVKKHGKVLYLNNELSFQVFVSRFKCMRRAITSQQLAQVQNFLTPEFVKPLSDSWDDICKVIVQEEPILVILDCLYWAHDRKENDSSEMKEIMRKFVELRDKYSVAVIVVHHTKKGVKNEAMHNDNIRGSQVFSASADTNILLRRSGTDESKRLFKPTKLRNGRDELRQPHLLSLETHSLWFIDEGIVNEEDHIAVIGANGASGREATEIDWNVIFGKDTELQRKVIVERCKSVNIGERTVDRLLRTAREAGLLVAVTGKNGVYQLPPSDEVDDALPLPVAA
jgi:hypothetical protein